MIEPTPVAEAPGMATGTDDLPIEVMPGLHVAIRGADVTVKATGPVDAWL